MKRQRAILFLLLATWLIAGSVLGPAADAVQTSGQTSGSPADPVGGTNGETDPGGSGRGDPGGAGDGLGADLGQRALGTAQSGGTNAVVEILLQLLRLIQAAG
ncbi:hypothetical protein FJ250_06590 [bacterium]|nr:hypothetical protein [bacterium]